MTHPSSLDLEAFACGEVSGPRANVAAHLELCPACRAFVERLGGLVTVGPTAAQADDLIARALRDLGDSVPRDPRASDGAAPVAPRAALVKAIEEARAPCSSGDKSRKGKSRVWLLTRSIVTPLAAAAAIVLLARSNPGVKPGTPAAPTSAPAPSGPDGILIEPVAGSPREPETTFKGGVQIAVVRDRAGEQARFASGVRVRPGDRLRVEVALDREQAILGGVLSDDGSYLEVMPLAVRGPGTHFSEKSAKIDSAPTYGTIVIGTSEAVARARATRQLDGLSTLRVEWEGTP
jgi:hypothetical protein